MINALGLLEVRGLATAIEAADAMLKAARVRILRQWQTDPGMISIIVEGDLAACRAALDAGSAAAARLGGVISRQEIGRPSEDVERLIVQLMAPVIDPVPASPSPAPASLDTQQALVNLLQSATKGMSLNQIQEALPQLALQRADLEALCQAGVLAKRQGRYYVIGESA